MSVYSDVRAGVRHGVWSALSDYFPDEATAPIIFSNLNGSEPDESYVAISILGIEQKGRTFVSTLAQVSDDTLTIQGDYEVRLQLGFCGSLSGELSQACHHIISSPVVGAEFRVNKLGFLRKTPIRRAPQKRDTSWIEYHNFDLALSYTVSSQQLTEIIEHVPFENSFSGDEIIVPPLP